MWGKNQDFPSKFLCLTVPRNAVGEFFSLSLFQFIEKTWMRGWGWGKYQDFPSKIFRLTVPTNAVGESLVFH